MTHRVVHSWHLTRARLDLRHRRPKGWVGVRVGQMTTVVPAPFAGWLASARTFLPPEFSKWLEGREVAP